MKAIPLTLLLFALPALAAAQTAGDKNADEPVNSYKSYVTGQRPAASGRGSGTGVAGQPKMGGVIMDCLATKPVSRAFDLRQPEDLKRDLRNVSFDPVTGKAAGFKLFARNF